MAQYRLYMVIGTRLYKSRVEKYFSWVSASSAEEAKTKAERLDNTLNILYVVLDDLIQQVGDFEND